MIHGIINVYKEKGYTSHDVVARLRGITGQRKVGHTGTLDPDAVGVLPVCFGRGTKLCDLLAEKDKVYEAVLLLGVETDTQDITGTVLHTADTEGLMESSVREAIGTFVGDYDQIPPMYSALKVGGKKLCDLAREGKTVERKARRVHIFGIEILEFALPRIRMRVGCSKGTYIRTLCHDIGQKLSCGGCMEELVRIRSGQFELRDAYTLEQIEAFRDAKTLDEIVLPVDQMFPGYAKMAVKPEYEKLAYNGNPFPAGALEQPRRQDGANSRPDIVIPDNGTIVRVYDREGRFIGLYRYREAKRDYTIVKMFFDKEDN